MMGIMGLASRWLSLAGPVLALLVSGAHADDRLVGSCLGMGCGTTAEIDGALFRDGGRYQRPTLWLAPVSTYLAEMDCLPPL